MTTKHARTIAEEIRSNIFGAGASETQRLGALAASTIEQLADELDAVKPPTKAEADAADDADEADGPATKPHRPAGKKT